MITKEKIRKVKIELNRFTGKLKQCEDRFESEYFPHSGCKETGALKRASLDLSNVLSDMRKTD